MADTPARFLSQLTRRDPCTIVGFLWKWAMWRECEVVGQAGVGLAFQPIYYKCYLLILKHQNINIGVNAYTLFKSRSQLTSLRKRPETFLLLYYIKCQLIELTRISGKNWPIINKCFRSLDNQRLFYYL